MAAGRRGVAAPFPPLPTLSGGLCAAALAWFVSNLPGPWAPPLIGWIIATLCALLATAFTWRVAGTDGLPEATRRFWRAIAIACLLVVAATISGARDALTGPSAPSQRISAVTVTLQAIIVLVAFWALLRLPGPDRTTPTDRRRFWLDVAIIMATAGLFTRHLAIRQGGASAINSSPLATITLILVTSITVLAFAKAAQVGWRTLDRRSLRLLSAAAAVGVAGGAVAPLLVSRPHLHSSMLVIPITSLALSLAAELQRRTAGRPAVPPARRRPFSLIPYAAVAATDALLLSIVAEGGREAAIVAAGAVALTGVVVYRQITDFADNARLLRQVDASVRELQEVQRQLAHQAQHDHLTGLANRRLFDELAREALADPADTCVVLIDLDDFKTINDRLGHVLGDALLTIVGRRLSGCVRPEDTVARLGGDEFALLLRGVSAAGAAGVLDRVAAALEQPVSVEGHDLLVRSSVGIAGAVPGIDPTELLRRADLAMYAAKERGKGRHAWYEPFLDSAAANDAQLGADLRQALKRGEFHLLYQPVVRLPSGRPAGAEALVRWQHPDRGLLRPDLFIAAAERTGLIMPLGDWILNEACRQAARWLRAYGATQPWQVSVNISARQLREPGFAGHVAAALRAADLPAERLMVEVTETAVFDNGPAVEALNAISALGVAVALDDFGTGHSSLGLLRTTPVDVLKVDKSFVDGITGGTEEAVIATAMIQLTRGLHLRAVAEGVETVEQARRLHELGYRLAQGFHFARPMPGAAVGTLLADEAARSVPSLNRPTFPAGQGTR
jgi:diguanylate cyclase (GGDEF)-like protein